MCSFGPYPSKEAFQAAVLQSYREGLANGEFDLTPPDEEEAEDEKRRKEAEGSEGA